MIDTHLVPAFGDTQLRLITKDSVQSFLNAKTKNGSSRNTVRRIRAVLDTIIEAAVRDELSISNPVRQTRLPRRGHAAEPILIASGTLHKLIENLADPRSIAA